MCGIVGAIGHRNVVPILVNGLQRLEYRGYDSAGVSILNEQRLQRLRRSGKVNELADAVEQAGLESNIGIAHTRWATHGGPSVDNAHPHVSGQDLALVHNGIIENHEPLKHELEAAGYQFDSDTDTEVVAHLLHQACAQTTDLGAAVDSVAQRLEGAYALAVLSADEPERLLAVRSGSPLVIGLGFEENFIASDQLALLPVTNRFIFLDEGEVAEVGRHEIRITDRGGNRVEREVREFDGSYEDAEKGEYRHFMGKEIFEQPLALQRTLEGRVDNTAALTGALGERAGELLPRVDNVQIVACGTSFHAGMVARYWIEALTGLPCQVEVASEFRYRKHVVPQDTLFVTVSQSGETADTLAALRETNSANYLARLAICNVDASSLVRESELVLLTRAGPEIGVASTKAFTTQLVGFLLLTLALARCRGLEENEVQQRLDELRRLPSLMEQVLQLDDRIESLAAKFVEKYHTLFLGRGPQYPLAMEGALKLKEISYIHAEAYPAGELKHGPLALVDRDMPVVAVAPRDDLIEKLKSNLQEVRARGGELVVFADRDVALQEGDGITVLRLPPVPECLVPLVYTVPLQLLSYHVAVARGTDVDKPRNLAKSVTVE